MREMSFGELHSTALQTRDDFISGQITPEEIVSAAEQYVPELADSWASIIEHGGSSVEFPKDSCGYATVVLRSRLGFGDVVRGSYGLEPKRSLRLLRYPERTNCGPHMF